MRIKREETDRKLVLRKRNGKSTFEKSRAKFPKFTFATFQKSGTNKPLKRLNQRLKVWLNLF